MEQKEYEAVCKKVGSYVWAKIEEEGEKRSLAVTDDMRFTILEKLSYVQAKYAHAIMKKENVQEWQARVEEKIKEEVDRFVPTDDGMSKGEKEELDILLREAYAEAEREDEKDFTH